MEILMAVNRQMSQELARDRTHELRLESAFINICLALTNLDKFIKEDEFPNSLKVQEVGKIASDLADVKAKLLRI
jgi:hypothetical protein